MYDWNTYAMKKMDQNKVPYYIPVNINKEKSELRRIIIELLNSKDKKRLFLTLYKWINLLKGKENQVSIRV